MFLSLILTLASVFASPEVNNKNLFIEPQIKVGMQIHGLHYWEKRSGILREKKNGVDNVGPFTPYAFISNGKYYEDQNLEYNLIALVNSGLSRDDYELQYQKSLEEYNRKIEERRKCERRCGDVEINEPVRFFDSPYLNKEFKRQLRVSNLNFQFIEGQNSTTIKATFKDKQTHSKFQIGGGSNRWDLASSNDRINGSIKVGYRLPENTWAVVFQRKKLGGVFNLPSIDKGFKNSFNSNLNIKSTDRHIVWGKPGTEVYQEFAFSDYSQGTNVEGEFEVVVTPIDFVSVQHKSLAKMVEFIFSIQPYTSPVSFMTHLENIKHILYLMSAPELREQLMNSHTTTQIIQLITKLSDVAYDYNADTNMWDLKAGSMILSHELSLLFLKQIVPFCRDEKIVLPYSKTEAQILGLKLANFFLEKAKARLEFEHFKHYETLLRLLSSYNGKSFSQIRGNDTEILKIKKAYDLLVNTVNMRLSSFKAAHDEIKFIYDKFGSLGAPGSENANVFTLIQGLNGLDSDFNHSLLAFLNQFKEGNSAKVSTSGLTSKLMEMKRSQKTTLEAIDSKIKIAGFTPEGTGSTFLQSVQAMTIHNVDVLSEPLDSSFESFRKSYFDPSKVNPILSQVQGCVR